MERNKRQYIRDCLIAMVVIGVLISVSTLIIYHYLLHWAILKDIGQYSLFSIISLILLYWVITFIRYKGPIRYIRRKRLLYYIERNLVAIGAYEKKDKVNYVVLPKIKINDQTIQIRLRNMKMRGTIERYLDSFSTALPDRYVVEEYYITQNNSELIIKYEDIKNYRPEVYTLAEYQSKVRALQPLELYFDHKHIVNMNEYPHFLISGTSGSGKSYLVNQLIIQAISKGWEIAVLDIKRSYGLYRKYIDYVYEIDAVLEKLLEIEQELYDRMKALQPELDRNPRALAVDIGYPPKLIVLEEYISLQAALDKKKKEELERVVKNLSVLARQSNIHLMIVLQAAGTENIQSTTRSNLTKVLLGNAQSNILTATFGTGVDLPNINVSLSKGQGLIQLDRISILRVPSITDIEEFK